MFLAFQLGSLFAAFSGVFLGMVFGCIPGLNATLGIALLLPVTLVMPPEQGLIMLGGVYVGAIYGGSIPAILLNIPGTAASLVTAMEGNLMAKQGRSELALNLSATSSGMGGLFSAVALLFLTPLLAKVALSFGPSEYVALIVFSLLIIVFVLPTPAFGNFTGVLIGLMLSLIGLDPFDGSPRFLFGAYQMASGLPLLPTLIGLFALPPILQMAWQAVSQAGPPVQLRDAADASWRQTFTVLAVHWATVLRASVVGLILGILPAVGPESTPIIAHSLERRFARRPKEFGLGSEQGLIAAETGNNANVGGSLIPLISLGIPGSGAAAMFLGALTIRGLKPGPLLLQDSAEVIYAFFTGFVVVNVMMMFFGLFAARYVAVVLKLPTGVIVTGVAIFATFGSYASGGSMFYVWVMLAAGLLSMAMRLISIPVLPVALGLLLGTMLEEQLVAMLTSFLKASDILQHPISMLFFAATLVVVCVGLWTRRSAGWFQPAAPGQAVAGDEG